MSNYDAIVVGLGAMGSAACRSLARRGARVLGIEAFEIAHSRGSSHGETRICRKAYFEHPDYVPLLHRAYELWDELSIEVGEALFHRCGLLLVGRPDGELIPGVQRSAAQHRLAIEALAPADVRRRLPQFDVPDGFDALFEADAGYLRVERCVERLAESARRSGVTLQTGERVTSWAPQGDGVTVRTTRSTYSAGRLIVAGGAWSAALLPQVGVPLVVLRKMQLWFRAAGDAARVERGCPVFAFEADDGFFYGFPAIDAARMKIAEHSGREVVADPSAVDRELRAADAPRVQRFIRRHVPAATTDVVHHAVCMYTMSPDGHFIVDRVPQCESVCFAAGFSGHGFKFAPVIGEILADLALHGSTPLPAAFLALDRPGLASAPARLDPSRRRREPPSDG